MPVVIDGTLGVTSPDFETTGPVIAGSLTVAGNNFSNVNGNWRNRIINGDMRIDQRNNGATVTPTTGAYTVDRFAQSQSGGGVISFGQSSTAPTGFTKSLLATVTTADSSIAANDFYRIYQPIEGFNVADLGLGTASAKQITVSFWVRSSVTGTFCLGFGNSGFNRGYAAEYTISSANTFEYKTVTLTLDTGGAWATDNSAGLYVYWDLGSGSLFNQTANAWAATNTWKTSSQTPWISTNGATFYITGIQLEPGSVNTPFERRPYGTELALCQRYYQQINSAPLISGYGSVTVYADFPLPTIMRVAPTGALSGSFAYGGGASSYLFNASYVDHWRASLTTTGTAYGFGYAGVVTLSAEL